MGYRIISDTSCDSNDELEKELRLLLVPFKISIEGKEFIDDDSLNLKDYIDEMIKSKEPIKTSCPSPFDYMEKLEQCEEEEIFIVTISSKLSGSYNSAIIARDEFLKEHPDKKVYVVDSKSASAGQLSVVLKIDELLKENISFDEKVSKIEQMVEKNITFFILESFDNLMKNGRIKKTAGLIATALNIRPIMKGENGEIGIHEISRGFKKSLLKLSKEIGNFADGLEGKILVISHVDGLEKAEFLAEKAKELYKFKDILIVHTKGLATGYADNGGIVVGI